MKMYKTVIRIEGMICSMCEAHICDAIRRAIPAAKQVAASKGKKEASFLTEQPVAPDALKAVIDATGYSCLGIRSVPYEKKGWFSRK